MEAGSNGTASPQGAAEQEIAVEIEMHVLVKILIARDAGGRMWHEFHRIHQRDAPVESRAAAFLCLIDPAWSARKARQSSPAPVRKSCRGSGPEFDSASWQRPIRYWSSQIRRIDGGGL